MDNKAARRIKKRQRSGSPIKSADLSRISEGMRFPVIVVLSLVIHAAVLLLINFMPEWFPQKDDELKVYSIEFTSAPGPMGGGGEEPEAKPEPKPKPEVEPEPEPEPEPEIPVQKPEPVKPEPVKPEPEPKPVDKPAPPKPEAKPAPAPKPSPQPAGPGVGPKGGSDSKGVEGPVSIAGGIPFPFPDYIRDVAQKTERVWRGSRQSYSTRQELMVEVTFKIYRGGSVSDARVTKSSNNSLVDRFAQRVIMDSSPYPSLPEDYDGKFLQVVYRFRIDPNR